MKEEHKNTIKVLVAMAVFILIVVMSGNTSQNKSDDKASIKKQETTNTTPKITKSTKLKDEQISYQTTYTEDPSIRVGTQRVEREGGYGTKRKTYDVTSEEGVKTTEVLISEEIIKQPTDRIVAKGTMPECVDVTSYDYNWNNDIKCTRADGSVFYTNYSGASAYGYQFR